MHSSDSKRSPGRLSRQGPEVLRWLLFEAAKTSARSCAPGYRYYTDPGRTQTIIAADPLPDDLSEALRDIHGDAEGAY